LPVASSGRRNSQPKYVDGNINNTFVTNITQILPKSTPTPTLNNNMSNYYHVLNENIDLDDDDDKTVITSNRSMKKDSDCATVATEDLTEDDLSSDEGANLADEKPHQKQREYAILDSGATAHFIVKSRRD